MSEGHREAPLYPLCVLGTEATIAAQRSNAQHATSAALMQQVVSTVLGDKSAHETFRKTIKELTDGQ